MSRRTHGSPPPPLSLNIRSYSIVTASYWGFTLTDGALRMVVLLHFHALGYSPVQLAFLFLLYEFCGVLTNLLGGWIGSRVGLKSTLFVGLGLQVIALLMLSVVNTAWSAAILLAYVMASQALSGIAKDLTKMSSKSAVKLLVTGGEGALFKWVSILTGSKNALKGVGFFLGGVLLAWLEFPQALWLMAGMLSIILSIAVVSLRQNMGKSKQKVKFTQLFSKSREINWLSSARFFLFASRDVWFVVALPVFLTDSLGWNFQQVGSFMAAWVIGYGFVQAGAPKLIRNADPCHAAMSWGMLLALTTGALAAAVSMNFYPAASILIGLALFGFIFAVNSSVHSYLILAFTTNDQVSLNVGFYYMANAWGRLIGTLLSGVMYLYGGLPACLWTSSFMIALAVVFTLPLRKKASS